MDSRRRSSLTDAAILLRSMTAARPGVERPDEEIRSDILYSLQHDIRIDISRIYVRVENGIVYLAGDADTQSACDLICSIARRTPGIVDLHDGLLVDNDEE